MQNTNTAPLRPTTAPGRLAVLLFALTSYGIGMAGLAALVAATFVPSLFEAGPVLAATTTGAVVVNVLLVAAFGVQHAIMARPAFKRRSERIVPKPAQRSLFVLLAGAISAGIVWFWQPLDAVVWSVDAPALRVALYALGATGWTYLVVASFAIDHFHLFGVAQAWRCFRRREEPALPMMRRLMYRFDRHPIMTGVLVGLWATPTMRLDHLVLALAFTSYVVIGVAMEERDLVREHGRSYDDYRRSVGSIVPTFARRVERTAAFE
ncbi:MAG: isoprenylcysteine carboxylmethyltransferase family protein [Planctomycetota bacterium]